ncbi:endonuclease domain-containing 1 protein-like [Chanodichthys erythropterus]|uniref:endonuclease domain-containing 1 protein-like n=1 Tax=Chanodichthys erythropterus TaxID=933992 RepID=UPI00351ECA1A
MHLFVVSVLLVFGFPFIMTDVVDSFSTCSQFFFDGQPPVIPGILENSESKDNRYKLICQKHVNAYRFATLYDTTSKIPVFSAYKYTEKVKFDRPKSKWRIEQKLENQASKKDYCKNDQNVNCGHLFPSSHAADLNTAKSTFTLTNAVPQKISFNSGSWSHMEQKTKLMMESHCLDQNNKLVAYVLAGAIPGRNKLKDRVNIPSHMWAVFCCYSEKGKSWVFSAHWAENKDETDNSKTIDDKTLEQLEEFLKQTWPKVQLFKERCNNGKLVSQSGSQFQESQEEDEYFSCEEDDEYYSASEDI